MALTDKQQKAAAKEYAEYWAGKGYEKGQSQPFWLSLLRDILGVEHPEQFISFEDQVHLDHTSFIDGYIKDTKVMIEQKSLDKDLSKPIKQSDGTLLTPFQQAKRYITELPVSLHPRWVVVCNFAEFLVYDMEKPNGEPERILLKDLSKDYYRLQFLADTGSEMLKREMEISLKAGELVGKLYDAILKQYKDPTAKDTLRSLNMLCVRLVFCLYAEDAGVFGSHEMFGQYLRKFPASEVRPKLIELFRVLDQKPEERDPYLDDDLAAFPYVNGGLFADENIEIPRFTEEIVDLLLDKASAGFDWSEISPTIFGAVFESTLNPETRRSGGMHYTSIQNIHKVIDPLFLDDLTAELEQISEIKVNKTLMTRLDEFTDKLSRLTFLDPACGSGNFLTETFLSLRNLENKALSLKLGNQIVFDTGDMIKVGIGQFYGIEINDFAATVAKTALWIAEHQMIRETETIVHQPIDFLPLKSYTNITEGNALRIDWKDVIAPEKLNYIMGNPPFVGANNVSKEQKAELFDLFGDKSKAGLLDYVAGWYIKATDFISNTKIKAAFVSTNSITQGEQVAILWKPIFERGIHINYAYRTFIWDSEASMKAHVHCVIVGFSRTKEQKRIFTGQAPHNVNNINGYLIDAPDIFIERRNKPICDVPKITKGCQPTDGGNLIIEAEDYEDFIKREPNSIKYIKKLVGAHEFLHNVDRYCLWLVDASPADIKSMPLVKERVQKCKEMREKSSDKGTQKLALTPTLFRETYNLDNYIIIPSHSSEARKYIPIGYSDGNTISTNANLIIQNATLYHFGILISNVHNAWTRAICGRIKSDYRYSKDIVYNNFPWCDPTPEQKAKIEETAQGILDARAKYPDCSLADLYDEVTMPPELRKAHQTNDVAVMKAYGLSTKGDVTEAGCVAFLFEKYREITEGK
ncbi:MAG: class I SAM-dependent DNA methyltransferase [Ruminiclostridium sp.]|uniref:DNA methyltransferase n=1 Tax=Ruminococcus sp. TaxID=41978 RepID=UPI0025CC879A|nr:DNA methyltransferase [Ruminococcus sp.]MBR1432432.1 class I SAM-dependent DNA methyltransferase [Ruminococcus sp.]MBR1833738.1 class I SAM-dependent DNA methyltransferase [Ruminiclostridium sp.]